MYNCILILEIFNLLLLTLTVLIFRFSDGKQIVLKKYYNCNHFLHLSKFYLQPHTLKLPFKPSKPLQIPINLLPALLLSLTSLLTILVSLLSLYLPLLFLYLPLLSLYLSLLFLLYQWAMLHSLLPNRSRWEEPSKSPRPVPICKYTAVSPPLFGRKSGGTGHLFPCH